MKVAIIGCRHFTNYEFFKNHLLKIIEEGLVIEKIISGGAKGVDNLAEQFAKEYQIETEIYKPEYNLYGKAAPMIRNKTIIDNSDMTIAFWDHKSKGTKNAIDYTNKNNKNVILINIE